MDGRRRWLGVLLCLTLQCRLVQESKHVMALLDGSLVLRWSRGGPGRLLLDPRSLWQTRPGHACSRQIATTGSRGSSEGGGRWTGRMGAYLRSLRWTPIPLGLGFALIAYQQYRHVLRRERKQASDGAPEAPVVAKPWEVSAYRLLPLRFCSRAWGWLSSCYLPLWARKPVLGWYVRTFGCDVSEAAEQDLQQYSSLSEFFRRALRPDVRPVDLASRLVSPCDGTVLHLGTVESGHLEQVKGVTYTLNNFLGPADWETGTQVSSEGERADHAGYQRRLVSKSGSVLYQCVIYLAPGDYHRFHSPADWTPRHRRHFPGDLLSVSPAVVNWIAGVFCLNERVVYTGKWELGFFALAAVGATNVGSIRVYCDEALCTNSRRWQPGARHDLLLCASEARSRTCLTKGAPFGEFNMGSTIVLVFEAPKSFQFCVQPGDKVRVGQSLSLSCTTADPSGEQPSPEAVS